MLDPSPVIKLPRRLLSGLHTVPGDEGVPFSKWQGPLSDGTPPPPPEAVVGWLAPSFSFLFQIFLYCVIIHHYGHQ